MSDGHDRATRNGLSVGLGADIFHDVKPKVQKHRITPLSGKSPARRSKVQPAQGTSASTLAASGAHMPDACIRNFSHHLRTSTTHTSRVHVLPRRSYSESEGSYPPCASTVAAKAWFPCCR